MGPTHNAPPAATCSSANAEEAAAWEAAWHSEAWLRALALFLRRVYGTPAELADAMLGTLGQLYAAGGFAAEGQEVAEQAWVHALGVAGLLLEQLTSARPALAAAADFGLRDLLDQLIQPGLRHRSAKVDGAAGRGWRVWLRPGQGCWGCSGAAVLHAACLPSLQLAASSAAALRVPDPLQVRREAVRCLGLYTFLDGIPTAPGSHLAVLRQVLITPGEASAVRAVAAQVRWVQRRGGGLWW